MSKTLEIEVYGRVQMVMFRDFVMRKSRKLDLKGFVKNKSNGSVFIKATGEMSNLHRLIKYLQIGSLLSRVDKIQAKETPHKESDYFCIRYG